MVNSSIDVSNQVITDRYALYNGDSCEVLKGIPSDSIHYSIFSPPFASLYTYSNSERDLGNCRTTTEFYEQFKFIASELYRVLMPGRLMSFHCMDLPLSKEHKEVVTAKVIEITLKSGIEWLRLYSKDDRMADFKGEEIGKTIFFTFEEAEEALKNG